MLACCRILFWRESLTSADWKTLSQYDAGVMEDRALTTLIQLLGCTIS